MAKVFISYSHDSAQHAKRVLEFSNQLRFHGVDAELDHYHTQPTQGWPRWCEEQLRPENSDFVLVICTQTYLARVTGQVEADQGKGVYWEGTILYNYLYNAKGNERFLLVMLYEDSDTYIPAPLNGYNRYRINQFELTDSGYEDLYRILTNQQKVTKPPLGKLVVLDHLTETVTTASGSPIQLVSSLPKQEVKSTFVSEPFDICKSLSRVVGYLQNLPDSKPDLFKQITMALLQEIPTLRKNVDVTPELNLVDVIHHEGVNSVLEALYCWLDTNDIEVDINGWYDFVKHVIVLAAANAEWLPKARIQEKNHQAVEIKKETPNLSAAVLVGGLFDVAAWVESDRALGCIPMEKGRGKGYAAEDRLKTMTDFLKEEYKKTYLSSDNAKLDEEAIKQMLRADRGKRRYRFVVCTQQDDAIANDILSVFDGLLTVLQKKDVKLDALEESFRLLSNIQDLLKKLQK